MNTETTQESLREFLTIVATRDIKHRYVHPSDEVTARLAAEIAKRSKCPHEDALFNVGTETTQPRYISADPRKFVGETEQMVEAIVHELKTWKAKAFDMKFKNKDCSTNLWNDKITVGVRYVPAATT